MYYWHWARHMDEKSILRAKRNHGHELVPRWDEQGELPLATSPPHLGTPELEQTHPFHGKMTPSMTLGPMCNHDLGVLLRLPSTTVFQTAEKKAVKQLPR